MNIFELILLIFFNTIGCIALSFIKEFGFVQLSEDERRLNHTNRIHFEYEIIIESLLYRVIIAFVYLLS